MKAPLPEAVDAHAPTPSRIDVESVPGRPLVCAPAPDPCTLIIFGITGDLARRKLIPALYNLALDGRLPSSLAIVGLAREPTTTAALRATLREALEQHSRRRPLSSDVWEQLASRISYVPGAFDSPQLYRALGSLLETVERHQHTQGNRLCYLATPPQYFETVVERLSDSGLLFRNGPGAERPWFRLVVEKPFGRDLQSALALDRALAARLEERQIFRIDHYLGKDTVENIQVLRFGNAIFEPLWNRKYIDNVQITAAENIGIEGRGSFYDATGVIRDMVQSHVLQVLALVAAEPPISFAANDVRDQQVQLLRSLHPMKLGEIYRNVVTGQYRGYHQEPGVAPDSRTATFVALKVLVDNWRWQGVPFYLRAGKRLAERRTEIDIQFKDIPLCLFRPPDEGCQNVQPNVLSLRIQPDEGVSLSFMAKVPGDHLELGTVMMNMSYASSFGRPLSDAYERLLLDVMRGDATLFARRDVVEEAWRFITPILGVVEHSTPRLPLAIYDPGSTGPTAADELLARDGRRWLR
jgi:glucose-6-phosphate 1-dehydrogenase